MASPRQGEGGSGGGGPVGSGGLGIQAEDLLDGGGGYSPRNGGVTPGISIQNSKRLHGVTGGSLGTGARFSTMRRRIPSGVEGLGVRVEEDFLSGSGGPRGNGGLEIWEAEKDTVEGGGPMGDRGLGIRRSGSGSYQLASVQSAILRRGNTARASAACPASRPTSSTASGTSSWTGTTCRRPLGTCNLCLPESPCCAKLYKKGIIQPTPICTHVPAAEKEGTMAKAEELGSAGKVVS
uniref:Uncharacterized protein n=1 Tax=Oryza meridionalis TaxID=40149 RepID=A0A0E0D4D3_9ORYZ